MFSISVYATVIELKEPSNKQLITQEVIQAEPREKIIVTQETRDTRKMTKTHPQTTEYALLLFSFFGFLAFGHNQQEKRRRGL